MAGIEDETVQEADDKGRSPQVTALKERPLTGEQEECHLLAGLTLTTVHGMARWAQTEAQGQSHLSAGPPPTRVHGSAGQASARAVAGHLLMGLPLTGVL